MVKDYCKGLQEMIIQFLSKQKIKSRCYQVFKIMQYIYFYTTYQFYQITYMFSNIFSMDQQCFICKTSYNLQQRYPMMLCYQQHLCCGPCMKQILKIANDGYIKCPQCRQVVSKDNIVKFRFFETWLTKEKQLKKINEVISKYQEQLRSQKIFIQNIITIFQEDSYKRLKQLSQISKENIFNNQNIGKTQFLLKTIIQRFPHENDSFIGLGSREQQRGFSEMKDYLWYQKQYNLSRLSLYDRLALSYMINANYQDQKEWYKKMLNLNKYNFRALYGLAVTQHNNGNIEIALELYQKIIDYIPSFDKPYEMIAFIHLQRQEISRAHFYSKECLNKNLINTFAEYIFTVTCNKKQEFIQDKLQKIIEKQPLYVRALNSLGNSYLKQHRIEEAFEIYHQSLTISKYYFDPYIGIAISLIKQLKQKQCIEILSLLEESPLIRTQRYDCYYQLGVAYERVDKYKAILYYKKCMEVQPNAADPLKSIGDVKKAITYYELCLSSKKYQKNTAIIHYLSMCYSFIDDYDSSIKWLYRQLEIQPQNIQTYVNLAQAFFNKKQYETSLQWYQKYLANNGKDWKVNLRIAQILSLLKRERESIDFIGNSLNQGQISPFLYDYGLQDKNGQQIQKDESKNTENTELIQRQ